MDEAESAKQEVIKYFDYDPLNEIKFENDSPYNGVDSLLDEYKCELLEALFYLNGFENYEHDSYGYMIYQKKLSEEQQKNLYTWLNNAIKSLNAWRMSIKKNPEQKINFREREIFVNTDVVLGLELVRYSCICASLNEISSLCFGFYQLHMLFERKALYCFKNGLPNSYANFKGGDYLDIQKQLAEYKNKEQKKKKDCSNAGQTTPNEQFKQWCIGQNKISPKNSLRQKALELAEYYQNNYTQVLKDFPNTALGKQDPFNTIYGWLKKAFPEQVKNKQNR